MVEKESRLGLDQEGKAQNQQDAEGGLDLRPDGEQDRLKLLAALRLQNVNLVCDGEEGGGHPGAMISLCRFSTEDQALYDRGRPALVANSMLCAN